LSIALLLTNCGGGGSNASNQDVSEDEVPELMSIDSSGNYRLHWSDEFNGTSLDATNWEAEIGYGSNGWGNDESQRYTDSADNLKVEDGNLVITARCSNGICGKRDGSITSARIITKDKYEFQYGKVEARIKVPSGRSTWPAFWMLGANFPDTGWPASGEIDIMEVSQVISNLNNALFAVHFCDDKITDCNASPVSGHRYVTGRQDLGQPLSNDFHVFGLEWSRNVIIGKIDGISYFSVPIDPINMSEFLEEFFLILNVAVDGTLGQAPDAIKTTPQEMLVDWVRVYEGVDGYEAPSSSASSFDSGLLTNGDFEAATLGWGGNAANVTNELLGVDGTRANFANVASAGRPFDVNLGQVVEIDQDKSYTLTFDAKSNRNRTMIAGIGLNQSPWTNDSETVNLTPNWQTFEIVVPATSFGNPNSRVFFDMGADTGQIIIDNVSLVEVLSSE